MHTVKLERRPLGEKEISRENGEGKVSYMTQCRSSYLGEGDESVGSAVIPVCVEVPYETHY